jgi:Uma2 family endonuclease
MQKHKAETDGGPLMSTMIATHREASRQTKVTPEELLAMPDGGHYELIDGELRERNMSLLSSRVAVSLARRLDVHCDQHKLGWVVDAECGYACFPWKPGRIRRADVSFIAASRLPSPAERAEGYVTIPPDLAVEVVSPNDYVYELENKVEEYIRAGVKLVWIVNPITCIVEVLRADGSMSRLRVGDELSGEDVLPGFLCRVDDLFPKPSQAGADFAAEPGPVSPSPA